MNLKNQNKFWPMVLSLTIIAIITGGLLAVVNSLTLEPIAKAKEVRLQNSLQEILPPFEVVKDTIIDNKTVYLAYADAKFVGCAITSDANGYGGTFHILVGYDSNGVITDYAIIDHQETPGLGAKMGTWFKNSVPGKSVTNSFVVSKDDGDIDGITAATITSRAFLKAVTKANETFFKVKL